VEPPARHPDQDTPEADLTFFVATVRPDGRPHSAGVGAVWVDSALYFTSGPGTLKSRNLAVNPACSVSVRLRGIDLVLEGEAHRATDSSTLERVLGRLPHGRLAGRGGRRRVDRPIHRAKRGPATLVPVPPHAAHRGRRGLRRAPRRHPLGLRPLGPAGSALPGSVRIPTAQLAHPGVPVTDGNLVVAMSADPRENHQAARAPRAMT
jgi:hypothetical protein